MSRTSTVTRPYPFETTFFVLAYFTLMLEAGAFTASIATDVLRGTADALSMSASLAGLTAAVVAMIMLMRS